MKFNANTKALVGGSSDGIGFEVAKFCKKLQSQGLYGIFVNNAGGPKGGLLLKAKDQGFQAAFQTHILSAQAILRVLVPQMKNLGCGRVVNIISTSFKIPIPNLGVSNTIRGAVAFWSKMRSLELATDSITVNNVLPGYTKTLRLEDLVKETSEKLNLGSEEVQKTWKAKVPMGRFGEAKEVAEAVCFLASVKASYINGVSLAVDGGRTGSIS